MSNVKLVKTDVLNGYKVYILKMDMPGKSVYHNGYVEINKNHKLYNVNYNDIDIVAHGGLTYSRNHLQTIVLPEDNKWILGFDTAHYYDDETTQNEDMVWNYLFDLTERIEGKNYDTNN